MTVIRLDSWHALFLIDAFEFYDNIIHSHVLLQTLNDPNFHCEISAALYFIPYLRSKFHEINCSMKFYVVIY